MVRFRIKLPALLDRFERRPTGSKGRRIALGLAVLEAILSNVRILIADDHEVVRAGLRKLLESQSGWCVVGEAVVGEAKDGLEAVESAGRLKPDVIIMDFGMPLLNGLEAVQRIAKLLPEAKTLILTMHDSDELLRATLRAGARGFLTKSAAAAELISAVDALRNNMTVGAPGLDRKRTGVSRGSKTESTAQNPPPPRLTSRQREIMQLVAGGKSTKEVAQILDLSVKTVETHRTNIMKRLNCHSVGELIRYAIRNGLVQLDGKSSSSGG